MDLSHFSLPALLADLVLTVHVGFVVFVVGGLIGIYLGAFAGWKWVRHGWFRALHLIGIAVVVAQAWLGVVCPLTTLEMWLRKSAGENTYTGSFIQYWLHTLLYYDAPAWVFIACYSVFGCLVLLSWFVVKPNRPLFRRPAA